MLLVHKNVGASYLPVSQSWKPDQRELKEVVSTKAKDPALTLRANAIACGFASGQPKSTPGLPHSSVQSVTASGCHCTSICMTSKKAYSQPHLQLFSRSRVTDTFVPGRRIPVVGPWSCSSIHPNYPFIYQHPSEEEECW